MLCPVFLMVIFCIVVAHVTHHTSHITHHTSHITYHTSHVTRHTSHITHHTSHVTLVIQAQKPITKLVMCFNSDIHASQWRSKITRACADAADAAAASVFSKKTIVGGVVEAVAAATLKTLAFRAHVSTGSEQHKWGYTPHTSHLIPHTSHLTPHTSHLTPHTSHLSPPAAVYAP